MSIDGIQVFCLLLLARQTNALGGAASIITEALSKLSFTIGLHIDPYYHSMNPFESELRRRLWLTVLELTAITSLNSTLPLLLVVGDYHVALPTNIADSKLGKADAETAQDHRTTKHEELDCTLQLLLAKSLRLRTQVIHDLNDSGREAVYEKAIAQSNSLQAHCRELAAILSPEEEGTTREGDMPAVGSSFHHKFLDTYFRRLVLFLHRPFAHQARQDHRFLLSRKTCLESSLIMAAHTEAMDLQSGELVDDFSYCCISGGGMFKGAMGQVSHWNLLLPPFRKSRRREFPQRAPRTLNNPYCKWASLTSVLRIGHHHGSVAGDRDAARGRRTGRPATGGAEGGKKRPPRPPSAGLSTAVGAVPQTHPGAVETSHPSGPAEPKTIYLRVVYPEPH